MNSTYFFQCKQTTTIQPRALRMPSAFQWQKNESRRANRFLCILRKKFSQLCAIISNTDSLLASRDDVSSLDHSGLRFRLHKFPKASVLEYVICICIKLDSIKKTIILYGHKVEGKTCTNL